MVTVECRIKDKDIVCSVKGTEYKKTDILIVVTKDMQIIYSNDSNSKYNIEYITMDCDYVEFKKTDDDENIVKCIIT